MRKSYLNPAHLREDLVKEQYTEYVYADLGINEAGGVRTAIVAKDGDGLWTCIARDGERTESRPSKTPIAAIRNATTL